MCKTTYHQTNRTVTGCHILILEHLCLTPSWFKTYTQYLDSKPTLTIWTIVCARSIHFPYSILGQMSKKTTYLPIIMLTTSFIFAPFPTCPRKKDFFPKTSKNGIASSYNACIYKQWYDEINSKIEKIHVYDNKGNVVSYHFDNE